MLFADAASPNLYDVLIALIQMIGTAFAVWVAYKQTTRTVASRDQVAEVHKTVNGNLDVEKKKVEKYSRKLRELGVEPDDL
jgi:hypothetical protein